MADQTDRNHKRIMNIKEYAYSVISLIGGMTEFDGDCENFDDPFYKNVGLIEGDIDLMKENLEGLE